MDFRIETERLLIRPWQPDDREPFRTLATDPRVMRYIAAGLAWSEEQSERFFARQDAHLRTRGFCLGALTLRDGARLVGLSGLQPLGTTTDVEVGWWLLPELWGRGLASEAGRGAIDHAFRVLALPRITAIAHPENAASIRVMERLGMRFERRSTGRELGLATPEVPIVLYVLENPGFDR